MNNRVVYGLLCGVALLLIFGGQAFAGLVQVAAIVAWIFGIVRGWQAHWLVGLASLLFFPIGVLIGAVTLFTGRNVAFDVVAFFERSRNDGNNGQG